VVEGKLIFGSGTTPLGPNSKLETDTNPQPKQPNPADWDENFPAGWHSSDVAAATKRVFKRIPGTWQPSMDGKLYMHQGYDVLTSGLQKSGWQYVVANDAPERKNRTFGHGQFMFSGGQRGGPLATYLASAAARSKDVFSLWTDTAVDRIVRDGRHATGVEVSCSAGSGYSGTVKLTPGTGRVVLSAGTFGTPKLLFRSGIGPNDQLSVVQASADGARMPSNSSWINLPVGSNLVEQMNVSAPATHRQNNNIHGQTPLVVVKPKLTPPPLFPTRRT
jgi:cellobiose dehydrogenase (acceptor)